MNNPLPLSPVERELNAGPRGDGKWHGFDTVYVRLQRAAHNLGKGRRVWTEWSHGRTFNHCSAPSEDHVDVMAAMGSGHEERMKAMLLRCIHLGWLTAADINETTVAA